MRAPRWPLAAAMLSATLLLAGCGSRDERLSATLERGQRALAQESWSKAWLEARNAVQIAPSDPRGHVLGATAAERLGDIGTAYREAEEAVELAPRERDPALTLARLEMMVGKTDKAATQLQALDRRFPGDPEVRTLRAALLAHDGNPTQALEQLEAVTLSPQAPREASLLQAGLMERLGDPRGALQCLRAALVRAPTDKRLLAAAAEIAGRSDDPTLWPLAEAWHRTAATAAPHDYAVWWDWAEFHRRHQQPEQAIKVLDDAIQVEPDDIRRRLGLVQLLQRERGVGAAIQALQAAVDHRPHATELRLRLADLLIEQGNRTEAQRVLRALADETPRTPDTLRAQVSLAGLLAEQGRAADARALLDDALRFDARDPQGLLLRARLDTQEHRREEAVEDLRSAAHERPTDPEIVGKLAQALRADGHPLLARDALADAVRLGPTDPHLRVLLAADMADTGETDSALRTLDEAIAIAPDDEQAYQAKARMQMGRHDLAGAEATWRRLLAAHPERADSWLNVAAMRALRDDPKGALALFDLGEEQHPHLAAIGMARAEWLRRTGHADDAIAAYRHVLDESPGNLDAANDLAWLLAQDPHDVDRLHEALAIAQRFELGDDADRLDTLGWIRLQAAQPAPAAAALRRALELAPANEAARQHLAQAEQALAGTGSAARHF